MTLPESAVLAADIILIDKDGKVLVIRRGDDPFKGLWALPGGCLNAGEPFLDAAIREAMEETSIDLSQVRLVEVGTYGAPGRDPRGRVVSIAFAARLTEPVTAVAGDDAAEARWVNPGDALRDGLAFDHDRILRDALRRLDDPR